MDAAVSKLQTELREQQEQRWGQLGIGAAGCAKTSGRCRQVVHKTDDQTFAHVVDAEAVPELGFLRKVHFRLDKNLFQKNNRFKFHLYFMGPRNLQRDRVRLP